eukprot:gene4987-3582_t
MGLFSTSSSPRMLSSFDPAKARSVIRMAISRITQRKSKTMNLVKYDSARIRVEGCIREEDSLDGYEALTILLEMISTRAQTLADSKSAPLLGKSDPTCICPPEMKEAVTSVIWASSVLGDGLPELVTLRKMFESKYGKDFVLLSVNNSDLSVNSVLMDRFSVSPKPQERCIQYLSQIAETFEVEDYDESKFREDPNNIAVVLGGAAALGGSASCPGAIHTRSGLSIPPMTVVKDDLDQRLDYLRLF